MSLRTKNATILFIAALFLYLILLFHGDSSQIPVRFEKSDEKMAPESESINFELESNVRNADSENSNKQKVKETQFDIMSLLEKQDPIFSVKDSSKQESEPDSVLPSQMKPGAMADFKSEFIKALHDLISKETERKLKGMKDLISVPISAASEGIDHGKISVEETEKIPQKSMEAPLSTVENEKEIIDIFYDPNSSLNYTLEQNDPRILKFIQNNHLWPPLPKKYNLKKPLEDPTRREGQNQVVLKLLKNKRNGIFVEAGANDGEFLSNTLALERDFGWTGILVEPDAKAFKVLQTKNRKAWLSNVCLSVSSRPERVKFLQYKRTSTWSKLAKVSDHHKKWKANQTEVVNVNCFPFFSIISALNMTTIDYFSLDIEGAELQILKTIPFDSVLIRTLSIEFDHIRLIPGADKELKDLMEANHFTLVTEVKRGFAEDYIYAHESVIKDLAN